MYLKSWGSPRIGITVVSARKVLVNSSWRVDNGGLSLGGCCSIINTVNSNTIVILCNLQ